MQFLLETRDLEGNFIPKEYCPIDGNFAVKYTNNENGIKRECINSNSSVNTCPLGSTLNVHLKSCSLENTGKCISIFFEYCCFKFSFQTYNLNVSVNGKVQMVILI